MLSEAGVLPSFVVSGRFIAAAVVWLHWCYVRVCVCVCVWKQSINGVDTDVVVTGYTDRVFVVVTQVGKMGGTLVRLRVLPVCCLCALTFSDPPPLSLFVYPFLFKLEATQSQSALALPGQIDYSVRTLLGKRDESLLTLFARQLIERLRCVGCLSLSLSVIVCHCLCAAKSWLLTRVFWFTTRSAARTSATCCCPCH